MLLINIVLSCLQLSAEVSGTLRKDRKGKAHHAPK